jgi:DNA-binding response OmpR family regulator
MENLTILLVEDDHLINRAWTLGLNQAGYNVVSARLLKVAMELLSERKFDAAIIDVNLEDGSGLELLKWLKVEGIAIKTLLVTARLDEETAILALQRGATEFIRKPIGPMELITRLDRIFRYTIEEPISTIHYKDLSLNELTQEIFYAGNLLKLSPSEYQIFRVLLKHAGSPITRELLLSALDLSDKAMDRTVDSHISRIRRKLKELAPQYSIESVWGSGYSLIHKTKDTQ